MIIAVGFKVNSERAVQFRKWVNQIAKDYIIKGWVIKLVTRDSITQAEFDTMMQTGLAQAKKNDSVSVDEAFNQLKSEI